MAIHYRKVSKAAALVEKLEVCRAAQGAVAVALASAHSRERGQYYERSQPFLKLDELVEAFEINPSSLSSSAWAEIVEAASAKIIALKVELGDLGVEVD